MTHPDILSELDTRLRQAVSFFWKTRDAQGERQGASTGDRGGRSAVTGGGHCAEFASLIRELLVSCGIPENAIHDKRRSELPGFFRATKDWDLVAVVNGQLVAVVEFKSQVGSFGNNFNNRTEEALGNATDIWTAYREGAFKSSPKPWLGYFMLLEEAEASTRARRSFRSRTSKCFVNSAARRTRIDMHCSASASCANGSMTPRVSYCHRRRVALSATTANQTVSCHFASSPHNWPHTPPRL